MIRSDDLTPLIARIQAIKRTPAKQLVIEAHLKKQLVRFFRGIGADVRDYILSLNRVPAPDDPALIPLKTYFNSKTREYQLILAKGVLEAFLLGQQRVRRKAKGRTHKAYTVYPHIDEEYASLLPVFSDLLEPDIAALLINRFFVASERTMDRVTGDVMANLAQSYADGLGNYDTAVNLSDVLENIAIWESERIARTEVNSAQNYGAFLQLDSAGVTHVMWITALDDRVRGTRPSDRADHIRMHGEVTRIGEPFSNGLLFPGDRDGPIEEWINCRCQIRDA